MPSGQANPSVRTEPHAPKIRREKRRWTLRTRYVGKERNKETKSYFSPRKNNSSSFNTKNRKPPKVRDSYGLDSNSREQGFRKNCCIYCAVMFRCEMPKARPPSSSAPPIRTRSERRSLVEYDPTRLQTIGANVIVASGEEGKVSHELRCQVRRAQC